MNLPLYHIKNFKFLSLLASWGKGLKYIPFLPLIIDEQIKLFTFLFYPRRFLKIKTFVTLVDKEINGEVINHRFGGLEFRYNKKEIAHIHSNGLLDIYFPTCISKLLIEQGRCAPHHIYPSSGWISLYLKANTDLNKSIQLIKWSKQLKTSAKTTVAIENEIKQITKEKRYEN